MSVILKGGAFGSYSLKVSPLLCEAGGLLNSNVSLSNSFNLCCQRSRVLASVKRIAMHVLRGHVRYDILPASSKGQDMSDFPFLAMHRVDL